MRNKRRNSIPVICIISLICMGLTGGSCKGDAQKGTILQKFEIINASLINVINGIKDSMYIEKHLTEDDYVIVMELGDFDSNLEFGFTFANKKNISSLYIYDNLMRIVGYTENNDVDVIILSYEKSKFDFERKFYKFLIPTKEKRCFEYIYFPEDLYRVDDKGIPSPPVVFDPHYYYFYFKEGSFIPANYNVP